MTTHEIAVAEPANGCSECGTAYETPVEVVQHARMAHAPAGPYAALAADLHAIADAIAAVDGPDDLVGLAATLQLQPHSLASDAETTRTVDVLGEAILGEAGRGREMSNGSWHHDASGRRGSVSIGIFGGITNPALAREGHRRGEPPGLTRAMTVARYVDNHHGGIMRHRYFELPPDFRRWVLRLVATGRVTDQAAFSVLGLDEEPEPEPVQIARSPYATLTPAQRLRMARQPRQDIGRRGQ